MLGCQTLPEGSGTGRPRTPKHLKASDLHRHGEVVPDDAVPSANSFDAVIATFSKSNPSSRSKVFTGGRSLPDGCGRMSDVLRSGWWPSGGRLFVSMTILFPFGVIGGRFGCDTSLSVGMDYGLLMPYLYPKSFLYGPFAPIACWRLPRLMSTRLVFGTATIYVAVGWDDTDSPIVCFTYMVMHRK